MAIRRLTLMVIVVSIFSLVAAACGSDDDDSAADSASSASEASEDEASSADEDDAGAADEAEAEDDSADSEASEPAEELGSLRFGSLTFANHGPPIAAQELGWFAEAGLTDVEIVYFPTGAPAIEALIGGDIDVLGVGAGPAINALAAGFPIEIIGVANDPTGLFTLVSTDENTTVADLEGKEVAVTLGTNFQYFLESALEAHGLAADAVVAVDMAPAEGRDAFIAGRVDATTPGYSDSILIPEQVEGASVIFAGTDFPNAPTPNEDFRIIDLYVTTSDKLDELGPEIAAALASVNRWPEYWGDGTGDNRDEAIGIVSDGLGEASGNVQDTSSIADFLDAGIWYTSAEQIDLLDGGGAARGLTGQAEFLVESGALQEVPDFQAASNSSLLK